MSTLVTGDWHLNDNPRDQYRHDHQKVLRSVIGKYGVHKLVILGDLTDEKDYHSAWLTNTIAGYVAELAALCRVIIVRGNHDAVTPDEPFFRFLGLIEGVTWVNSPRVIDGELYLPYTDNWKRDWEEKLDRGRKDWDRFELAFTHNTFDGVRIGHGETLKGIPLTALGSITTFSGDIHIPQTLGNITYVGAPYLVDFGDDYDPRLILIAETIKSLKLPGRQKRLVEIKSLDGLKKVEGVNPGDILKVRVQLSSADHAKWPAMQEAIRKWGADNNYQVHTVVPLVLDGRTRQDASVRRSRTRRDDKALVTEYGKARGIAQPTLKVGLELMEEV